MTRRLDAPPITKCPAHKKNGEPCGRNAGHGTDHLGHGLCKFHGGASPGGRKHGQKLAADAAVATYGLPREIDPQDALVEELHRTAGHVAWLAAEVAELERAKLYGPVGGAQGGFPSFEPHVLIKMLAAERKHFLDVAKTCITVGIAERQVRIAEQQGELIAQVLRGVLRDLGVADDPRAPEVVRRHLTMVAGAAA
jgi:hypothetical protein